MLLITDPNCWSGAHSFPRAAPTLNQKLAMTAAAEQTIPSFRKRRTIRQHLASLARLPMRLSRSIRKRVPKALWRIRHYFRGETLSLISLSDFTKQHPGVKLFRVSDARKTPIRQPAFVAFAPKIDRSKRFLVEPQINVVEHRDATALAASDFILRDGYCIHPDQFVPERDVCMSERYGVTKLDLRKRQMQHVFEVSLHMKAAISLLGQCAGNYAHFLTEVLPKLPVIDQIPAYKGLPILVDDRIHHFALRSGFDLLEPSSLTIQEQIDAFRDVEEVIAPIGAALANLVFTKPGCKVTCLSAYFDGGEYDYWSTLMAALGHELKFVVGPQIETPGGHPLHHDYRISMSDLAAAIADEPAPSGCCAGLLSG